MVALHPSLKTLNIERIGLQEHGARAMSTAVLRELPLSAQSQQTEAGKHNRHAMRCTPRWLAALACASNLGTDVLRSLSVVALDATPILGVRAEKFATREWTRLHCTVHCTALHCILILTRCVARFGFVLNPSHLSCAVWFGIDCAATMAAPGGTQLSDHEQSVQQIKASSKRCKLESLQLRGNSIGDRGAEAIARAFLARGSSAALRELWLEDNGIMNDGAESLAKGLAADRTLTGLHLFGNAVGRAGAEALLKVLRGPTSNAALVTLELFARQPHTASPTSGRVVGGVVGGGEEAGEGRDISSGGDPSGGEAEADVSMGGAADISRGGVGSPRSQEMHSELSAALAANRERVARLGVEQRLCWALAIHRRTGYFCKLHILP
jgi:hypothetical protein